ncbi:hypothetical protein HZC53_03000 [Candidatus Uhrbacteria bacterium]|nr:hypothetical protein [Candidatus Uhrbacteria bacterium]
MEHNRKPGSHSAPKPAKPPQPATPTPISIKQLAANVEAARTGFEANLRNSLVDGGQADVLSQRIHTLLISLDGGRHLIDSAVFNLARELANFDCRNRGAPPSASSAAEALLQQRLDQSLALIIQLEEKSTTGQAKFDELMRQLKDREDKLAEQSAKAEELGRELSAYRRWENSEAAKSRIVALDLEMVERNKKIRELNIQINDLHHETARLREENGDFRTHIQRLEEEAKRLEEATATITELRRLLESQEAAKRDLGQDLHRAEKALQENKERLAEYEALLENLTAPGGTTQTSADATATTDEVRKLNERIAELNDKLKEQDELVGRYAATIQESGGLVTALDAKKRALETEVGQLRKTIDECNSRLTELERQARETQVKLTQTAQSLSDAREEHQKQMLDAEDRLEETTGENRRLGLEIQALRDANSAAADKLAATDAAREDAESEAQSLLERIENAEAEVEGLKQTLAENLAQAEILAQARAAAEQAVVGMQASVDALRALLNPGQSVQSQPQTRSLPYDPKGLESELERRRQHLVLVEEREADANEMLERLASEIGALKRLPDKSPADETRLNDSQAEYGRLLSWLEGVQEIKEELSSQRTHLQRLLDAERLIHKGLPKGLMGAKLPEIPELIMPVQVEAETPANETDAAPEPPTQPEQTAGCQPEPPQGAQGIHPSLKRLSKECGISPQAVLIAALYEIVPGKRIPYPLDRLMHAAACANIIQRFGWSDKQVQEVLHGHWRGDAQELHQIDQYLRSSTTKNSFVRMQRPLPWDTAALLTGQEVADFKKWFLTYLK